MQKFLRKLTLKNLKGNEPDIVDAETGDFDLFETLKWLWDNFGEQVLKGNPFFRKKAASMAAKSDELQELMNDPDAYEVAFNRLIEDVDVADLTKVLSILKVPTPDELRNTLPLSAAK